MIYLLKQGRGQEIFSGGLTTIIFAGFAFRDPGGGHGPPPSMSVYAYVLKVILGGQNNCAKCRTLTAAQA